MIFSKNLETGTCVQNCTIIFLDFLIWHRYHVYLIARQIRANIMEYFCTKREKCDFYLYFFCQSGLIEYFFKKTSAQWRLQKCEYFLNGMTVLGTFCREYSQMIGQYVCKRILHLNHFSLNEIFAVCVSRKIFGFQRLLQNCTFWTKFTIIFHDFLRKHAK